jgi:hypothetical protein
VQWRTIQDEEELADAQTIQTEPPHVAKSRYGFCNCALIKDVDDVEVTGIHGTT